MDVYLCCGVDTIYEASVIELFAEWDIIIGTRIIDKIGDWKCCKFEIDNLW